MKFHTHGSTEWLKSRRMETDCQTFDLPFAELSLSGYGAYEIPLKGIT